ncbi:MAG TPA: hypothetical protein VKP64_16320 [Mycobacteriales bacterium]|nr:hypothetical protein [Mycobacteriales bacterium]
MAAQLLAERQRATGAPQASWIRVSPLTDAGSADRKTISTIRALVSVVVLGIAATVLLAFTVEGMARRRAARAGAWAGVRTDTGAQAADAPEHAVVVASPTLPRRVAER